MPTAGTDVTKSSIVDEFNTNVTNVANAGVSFDLSSNPFTANGVPAYANASLSNTYAVTVPPGDLTNSNVVASEIASVLRNYAYNASRIRNTQYYYNYFGSPLNWGQGITVLNDSYRDGAVLSAGTAPTAGTDIDATGAPAAISDFILALQSAYITARNTLVTLTACHSSCHASCHGARGRR